jgi:hypothetical protein
VPPPDDGYQFPLGVVFVVVVQSADVVEVAVRVAVYFLV